MYNCFNCNTMYKLSEVHYKYIDDQCEKNGIINTLVICPQCRTPHIVGGESDWDEISDQSCIMMFGRNINHSNTPKGDKILSSIMAFEGVIK